MRVSCACRAAWTAPASASSALSKTTKTSNPTEPRHRSLSPSHHVRQEKIMGQYVAPIRDMQFLLHEFLNVSDELKQMPQFEDVDADIINQVLEEGAKFTQE